MPHRPPHPCSTPGCTVLIYKGSRCAACEREARRRWEAEHPRPSPSRRGYGQEWRAIRGAYLAAHPYCANPFNIHIEPVRSAHVDHIKAKKL